LRSNAIAAAAPQDSFTNQEDRVDRANHRILRSEFSFGSRLIAITTAFHDRVSQVQNRVQTTNPDTAPNLDVALEWRILLA
jgi:hypothetical protein